MGSPEDFSDDEPPDDDFGPERLEADVIALEEARDKRIAEFASRDETPPRPRWRLARDVVPEIRSHADDPRAPITIGSETLVDVEPGDIIVLIAASKRGKTSLALCCLHDHARDRGPAIAVSLELPARQLVAREIGARRDAAWRDVLRGTIADEDMRSAIPERLAVVDRDEVEPLVAAARATAALRASHPGEPVLVAVDYIQLIAAEEREIRARVDAAMRGLSRWARDLGVTVLALSQSSRVSSRALTSGERTGADSMDTGAESAAIERWASVIVTLGAQGDPDEHGSAPVELSIAGARMDRGDQVRPARYEGRTGRWTLAGESRAATEVRAERGAMKDAAKIEAARLAIVTASAQSDHPQSREDLGARAACRPRLWRAAIAAALAAGDLVQVDRHPPRSRAWLVWTRDRAVAAGLTVLEVLP